MREYVDTKERDVRSLRWEKNIPRYRGLAVFKVLVVLCCACVMPAAAEYHEVGTVVDLLNLITWSNDDTPRCGDE